MDRRRFITAGLTVAGALATPAYLRAQSNKKLSLLTWNFADQEALIKDEFADFKKDNPGVELEWLDKKGTELPAFYQTQLVAGTPPDVVDLQAQIWVDWAANGALLDLTPFLDKEPQVKARYNADYLTGYVYDQKTYLLPFYVTKSLIYYNKPMFKAAGIADAPKSFDDIINAANAMAKGEKTGFLTLNFDWLYWPLMKENGIDLLKPDMKTPAFNTPEAITALDKMAKATASGGINKIAWTGRWVEPNGAFAAGNVGMLHSLGTSYFFVKGQGQWVSADTLGVAEAPGDWATPNNHGFAVSKTCRNPELAFALIKHMTGRKWATEFANRRHILTANNEADEAALAKARSEDPLGYEVMKTQNAHTDKLTGDWPLPNDARLQDAFWPEFQNAMLGRKDARTALADAEKAVTRVMRRS
jgi:ABC-type glycerol-3-phosphate transport system substrate-binding protein